MPRVFIPPLLRPFAESAAEVNVEGATVRQVIAALEALHPGLKGKLVADGQLKSGLQVAVDGHVSSLGLLQKVSSTSEIHFLSAIGGG